MNRLAPFAALLLLAACASTAPVRMDEPRRVVGTESNVRVDAEVFGDRLSATSVVPITYDITNERPTPIAVAELIPEVSYDAETQTVTVGLGSEVPGASLIPRLILIGPGEKKTFSTTARVSMAFPSSASPFVRYPNALRLKLSFLGDTAPFAQFIGIAENGVADAKLADEIFPKWLESNETLYTNTVPMRWGADPPLLEGPPPASRRRG